MNGKGTISDDDAVLRNPPCAGRTGANPGVQVKRLPYIPPSRQRLSRRAEEYLRAHLEEPVSIQMICRAVGGASRTLHVAFRECYGVSPKKYSKELRLNAVRRCLLEAESATTVTDAAMRWGFFHLGRFSQEYRRRFGESPSATLRSRACSAVHAKSRRVLDNSTDPEHNLAA